MPSTDDAPKAGHAAPHDKHGPITTFSLAGALVALGIVFGDLGTSPLYTFKAIIGARTIAEELVLGAVSAIFWTLTLQTTLKYVLITMRADNKGEGGIFSLYTLIRRYKGWLLWPAIVGASFMIADSLITPPISVISAMEGLLQLKKDVPIIPISIGILVAIFLVQQSGASKIGKYFGPAMLIWFTMIAGLGILNLLKDLSVLRAFNPMYAYRLLREYPGGFWVLGGVFLCCTGAEALYADMGHVGRKNIQIAWIAIKVSLVLCYFGEAALLMQHIGGTLKDVDPFYDLVPRWFLIPSIIVSAAATIIASQALISGTFTLFNEAVRLNVWPKLRIEFPSELRGQVYVPAVNWMMMAGCIFMVLYFKESAAMEAAFGLSVTLTMLMTTILLSYYLYTQRVHPAIVLLLLTVFLTIECSFLVANLAKFSHGGYITVIIGALLVGTMFIWHAGRRLKAKYKDFCPLATYLPKLRELSNDTTVPKYATHLVYLTICPDPTTIETRILDSIFSRQPKRADFYWFVHLEVDDSPYTMKYSAKVVEADEVVFVAFRLGFRVVPRLNLLFKDVVAELTKTGEVNFEARYALNESNALAGDFRFVIMRSFLSVESNLGFWDNLVMRLHFILSAIGLPDHKAYGLDYNNVTLERTPLVIQEEAERESRLTLTRE
jgi:KUP system potassium uptake protein